MLNIRRSMAFTMRYLYLYKRSVARLMEIFYWPLLDLVVWGFITAYLSRYEGVLPSVVTFLIGALILWDILFRSQQGLSISFLEDMWSRNLVNIFVSPLRPGEYVLSLIMMGAIKLALASIVMVTVAFFLYNFNIFQLGFALLPLVINLLVMGWAIGIITMGVILRFGQEAEVMAWGIAFLFQPLSAVFYPVDVLPPVIQKIAFCVPSSHIFEGMREVITYGTFPTEHLLWATGINIIYLALAIAFFYYVFTAVKEKGLLTKIGE